MNRERVRSMDPPGCPSCRARGDQVGVAVRQGKMDMADLYPHLDMRRGTVTGVADVGYGCRACGHEWGWEHLTDQYLTAVELLTGGRTPDHQEKAALLMAKLADQGWKAVRVNVYDLPSGGFLTGTPHGVNPDDES